MEYYLKSSEDTLSSLNTTSDGLTGEEAARRLAENGKNKLAEPEKDSLAKRFLKTIADPMILLLIAAAAVQALVTVLETTGRPTFGDFTDVIVILAVVILNAAMSIIQENKASAAMEALMQMTALTSKVLRDGKVEVVKSEDLVVGDVLVLEAGDAVPADCRVLESYSMKAEESFLTGESNPVSKVVDMLMCTEGKKVALGDRENMLFSGSTVVYGRGRAVITACGMDTEMGRIADALSQAEDEKTPLQIKLTELSAFLTKLVLGICLLVFIIGLAEGLIFATEPFSVKLLGSVGINTFVAAIALAVAAIPEGLPAVVTILLSIGVTRMANRQALVRKLTAVETLGCTQIICSDKTGTLTQNKMTVVDVFTEDKPLLAQAMACCSDSRRDAGMETAQGEPTENALVNFAYDLGLHKDELDNKYPRVGEAPFDSLRKRMSTIHNVDGRIVQYTKGAAEMIMECCTGVWNGQRVEPVTEAYKQQVRTVSKEFSDRALRVLGAAYREYEAVPSSLEPEDLEKDLIFIGCVGMIDPCRPEVYDAIRLCRQAGIRPIMITGDHKDTAVAIGRDLGIIRDASEAIVGADLDAYTDEELLSVVPGYSVYARVQPEHKVRIVDAWQALGKVTAMTGDGVNDAPSIKAADIGIGMGITGTDVTKGAADIVLADDNFATIVNAVEEGRRIYDNVCKVIQLQLSTNMSEVIIMFVASLLHFTILTPVHLLWVNMVTDSLPGLALGMEPAEGDLMRRRPRDSKEGIFSGGAGIDMVWQGVYIAAVELASYFFGYHITNGSLAGVFSGTLCVPAMAMAFLTVNFSEMLCAVCMRSRRGSIFTTGMIRNINWWLVGAFLATTLITVAAVSVPGLQNAFGITPGTLTMRHWLISCGLALSVVPAFELGKFIHRRVRKQ